MSNKTSKGQLTDASKIYEQAHLAHDINAATDVLQLVSDALWEFGKVKKPSAEHLVHRQKLVEAIEILQVKDELLGNFEGASAQERRAYVMSLAFANKEKNLQDEKLAKTSNITLVTEQTPAFV